MSSHFTHRRIEPEVMDDPGLNRHDHVDALRSLSRVNRLLGTDRRLMRRVLNASSHVSILDVACGAGGFLGSIAGVCAPATPLLIGLDRSPTALDCAARTQPKGIRWVVADAAHLPFSNASIDTVTCALFLHHLEEPLAVRVLREAARVARHMVVVVDLRRSTIAWTLTWLVTRIVSRSWVFRVDGPRSVRAAFQAHELHGLARRAGWSRVHLKLVFPFRMVLTYRKDED
jgi:ubiquinone/menaquinone biosynthesis C-methylase UbiE